MVTDSTLIKVLSGKEELPLELLLLADPSVEQINEYLANGICYVAKLEDQVVGAMVIAPVDSSVTEICNIAVVPSLQGQGIGKQLLRYACQVSQDSEYKSIRIATGNSSIGQLALYQKEGFEIIAIEANHFTLHYQDPIIENGIECKHKIVLEKHLSK